MVQYTQKHMLSIEMTCFLVSNRAQCYTVLTESYTDVFIQNCEDELFIPGKLNGKKLKNRR